MAGQNEYWNSIGPAASAAEHTNAGAIRTQAVDAVRSQATLRLTGSLEADEKSDVGSNATGMVAKTCIERGSVVKKGDLLVQLDPRDAQYALDEGRMAAEELRVRLGLEGSNPFRVDEVPEVEAARLTMELAEKNHQRAETLRKHHAVAQAEAEQMQTDYRAAVERFHLAKLQARQLYQSYRSAQTHLVTLQKAVDDCSICAPFDGWVAERDVSVGERVIALFPSGKLATVLRIDPLRLRLTVPQQETARIKAGQRVTFQADAHAGRTFTGTVRYIAPAVAAENRSLCVEAVVPNPGAVLRPGLFVGAELQLDEERTEVLVPRAAVRQRGDVAAVFVVRGRQAREQIVSLGEPEGPRVRVTSGLAPGDVVVTTPESVRDGDEVSKASE